MKKISILVLVLTLCGAMAACGCMNSQQPGTSDGTTPTDTSTTAPSVLPDITPTLETNIPDPSVDTSMPDFTDATDTTDTTDTGIDGQPNSQGSVSGGQG